MTDINPEVIIKEYEITKNNGNKIMINVIRDDLLPGGTKQRGLYDLMKISDHKVFVYASPLNGYAMVAISYCSKLLGKIAVIFVAGTRSTKSIKKALKYGAIINYTNGTLKDTQDIATAYATKENAYLVPFGGDSPDFNEILYANLKIATSEICPKRIWVPVGSGTLVRIIMKIWPDAYIIPIRIGKNIWEDQYTAREWEQLGGRTRIDGLRVADDPKLPKIAGFEYQQFSDKAPILPPWPSMITYDAKMYQRILQFGSDGDYVWNVAP